MTCSAVKLIWCTRVKHLQENRRISWPPTWCPFFVFLRQNGCHDVKKAYLATRIYYCNNVTKYCISKFFFVLSWPAIGIGCFRDTGKRAISTLEGRSFLLTGSYRSRRYAIEKCAQAAYKRGYKLFAVQHGGWCAASRNGHRTYARYGKSNKCRNGKGGPWANDVYVLRGGFPVVNLTWQWASRQCFHIFFR